MSNTLKDFFSNYYLIYFKTMYPIIFIVCGLLLLIIWAVLVRTQSIFTTIKQHNDDRAKARSVVFSKYPPELVRHYKNRYPISNNDNRKYSIMSRPFDVRFKEIKNDLRKSTPGILPVNVPKIKAVFGMLGYVVMLYGGLGLLGIGIFTLFADSIR